MIGASMLWFGWFGFNAGSALEANGSAALAFMNTYLATACAVLSWMTTEWLVKGKPSMLGAASGAVAGLVAITPAAGNVGIPGAFAIGIGVGIVCLWGVTGLKKLIRPTTTGRVRRPRPRRCFWCSHDRCIQCAFTRWPGFDQDWVKGTVGYPGIWPQLLIQIKAVVIVTVWTAVVATVAFLVVKAVVGLRVTGRTRTRGSRHHVHGERAYDIVIGFSPATALRVAKRSS